MTAVAPKIEPPAHPPGPIRAPRFADSFREHLRPAQVNRAVRHRMAHQLMHEQWMWSVLIVSTCMMFALLVLVVFQQRELAWGIQLEALRPVSIACVLALLVVHIHYRRSREFVRSAPVAAALVIREKDPWHFDEASSLAVPRLLLRYLPRPAEEDPVPDELHRSTGAHTLWAELDGFSARFERTVHAGDLVSILYDPTDPEHVRVVELERGTV